MINKPKGLTGWMESEMGNLSDNFAYTKIDRAMPQSFFRVNSENNNSIFTPPNMEKINKNNQKKLINDMEKQRSIQDTYYKNDNKQQQLQFIANDEQKKMILNTFL